MISSAAIHELSTWATPTLTNFGFPNTVALLNSHLNSLQGHTEKDLQKLFGRIRRTFYQELYFPSRYYKRVFDLIFDGIVLKAEATAKSSRPQYFLKYNNQLVGRLTISRTVNILLNLQQLAINDEQRYYLNCVLYQLLVEGVYDENIRILYDLWQASQGHRTKKSGLANKALRDLKKEMESHGFRPLFTGWNSNLRNSIAHARFTFVHANSSMIFKDVNRKGKTNYRRQITLDGFEKRYLGRIWIVCRCNQMIPMLGRIHEIFFMP